MAKHRRHVRSFSYSHCIDDETRPPSLLLQQKVVGWVPEKKSLGTVRYFDRNNKSVKRGTLCEDGVSISAPDGVFEGVEGWILYSRSFEERSTFSSPATPSNALSAVSKGDNATSGSYNSPVSSHKLLNLGLEKLVSKEDEGKDPPLRSHSRLRESRRMSPPKLPTFEGQTDHTLQNLTLSSEASSGSDGILELEKGQQKFGDKHSAVVGSADSKQDLDCDSVQTHFAPSLEQSSPLMNNAESKLDVNNQSKVVNDAERKLGLKHQGKVVPIESLRDLTHTLNELRLLDRFPQLRNARQKIACTELEVSPDGHQVSVGKVRELETKPEVKELLIKLVHNAASKLSNELSSNIYLFTGDISLLESCGIVVCQEKYQHSTEGSGTSLVNGSGQFNMDAVLTRLNQGSATNEDCFHQTVTHLFSKAGPELRQAYLSLKPTNETSKGYIGTTEGYGLYAKLVVWTSCLGNHHSVENLCKLVVKSLEHCHAELTKNRTGPENIAITLSCLQEGICGLSISDCVLVSVVALCAFMSNNANTKVVLCVQTAMQQELCEQYFRKLFDSDVARTASCVPEQREDFSNVVSNEPGMQVVNSSISATAISPSAISTSSASATSTASPSETSTASPSITSTASPSTTSTASPSATSTASPSATSTASPSATSTASPSTTSTASPSATSTASPSATSTASPSATSTASPSATSTASPSATSTASPSATSTASPSATSTASPSATSTASPSATSTASPSATSIASPSATSTASPSATSTASPSATSTASPSATSTTSPSTNNSSAAVPPSTSTTTKLSATPSLDTSSAGNAKELGSATTNGISDEQPQLEQQKNIETTTNDLEALLPVAPTGEVR